eukprot:6210973-Pleurochrysis_carterae.AAC.1
MHSFACSLPLALLFLCSSCASSVVAPSEASLTFVNKVASKLNCKLIIKATGPAYRLELHSLKLLPGSERYDQPSLLGYSDGFTLPTGAVHLESIQFRRYTGYWGNSGRGRQSSRYAAVPRAGSYGLGLLLSVAVFCWINECDPFGCKRAQVRHACPSCAAAQSGAAFQLKTRLHVLVACYIVESCGAPDARSCWPSWTSRSSTKS